MKNLYLILLAMSSLMLLACAPEESIKKIDIKVEGQIKEELKGEEKKGLPADTKIILGYVLPTSSQQWFVKIAMASGEFEKLKPMLDKLKDTFKIDEHSVDVVSVDLPEGWSSNREKGLIHSTISHKTLKSRIIISKGSGSLLKNINEWNKELGNRAVSEDQLSQICQYQSLNGRFALLVTLVKQKAAPQGTRKLIFAGIFENGGKQWFIKAMSSTAESKLIMGAVDTIFKSIKFKDGEPSWDVAPGWTTNKGSGFTYASVTNPNIQTRITVSTASGSLLANLNRWNRQLGNSPFSESELTALLQKTGVENGTIVMKHQINENPVTVVLLTEKGGEPQVDPHAGHDHAGHDHAGHDHAGHDHGSSSKPTEANKSDGPVNYQLPQGWTALPAKGMRALNLKVGDCEITGIRLFKGARGARKNVDRWCGQVGLKNLSDEELKKQLLKVKIDGLDGQYILLKGKERAIIVAMVDRGDGIWFFKGVGKADVIAKERENFEKLISSIKFNEEVK